MALVHFLRGHPNCTFLDIAKGIPDFMPVGEEISHISVTERDNPQQIEFMLWDGVKIAYAKEFAELTRQGKIRVQSCLPSEYGQSKRKLPPYPILDTEFPLKEKSTYWIPVRITLVE